MSQSILSISGIPRKEKVLYNFNTIEDKYTKIPEIFISKDTWPKSCNQRCYNCFSQIDKIPLFVPISIENKEIFKGNRPVVCCRLCLYSQYRDGKHSVTELSFIRELLFRITGKKETIMEFAPDRSLKKIFCGYQTDQEYQEQLRKLDPDYFSQI